MNNLHRELAPISAAAWASIEEEAKRSFTLQLAGRRVAEVRGAGDDVLSAVGTGHLAALESPAPGVLAWARTVQPIVELRVPFTRSRSRTAAATSMTSAADEEFCGRRRTSASAPPLATMITVDSGAYSTPNLR